MPIFPGSIPLLLRSGKRGHWEAIRRAFNLAAEIVNGCDAGREGELIAARVFDAARVPERVVVTRMWVGSLQAQDVRRAFDARRSATSLKYQHLREAAEAASEADWLWGFNLTRYATLGLAESWQGKVAVVGRIKTPTLGEVVARERERCAWKREPFWCVRCTIRGEAAEGLYPPEHDGTLVAFLEDRYGAVPTHFRSLERARAQIMELGLQRGEVWKVQDVAEAAREHAPPPFSLLDLQRSAFRIWGWTARHTLQVAQRLYTDERAITYPRTASAFIPESLSEQVEALRQRLYAAWALDRFPRLREHPLPTGTTSWTDSTQCREHHAILPTGVIPESIDRHGQPREEYLLWELITVRTLLAWCPPAVVTKTTRVLLRHITSELALRVVEDAEPVDDPGWLFFEDAMYNTRGYGKCLKERMRERALPDLGSAARVVSACLYEGSTTRPDPHNEETLLGWMERSDIGTPATRAECIEELVAQGFVVRMGRGSLVPTEEGATLIGALEATTGEELVTPRTSATIQEAVERIAGMSDERPTKDLFLCSVRERILALGGQLTHQPGDKIPAYCPRTGRPPVESPDGRWWTFAGFPDARCLKQFGGRAMEAFEWARVLAAGPSGAGPFEGFFSRTTGNQYDAKIAWRPKLRKFEFVFSQRESRR